MHTPPRKRPAHASSSAEPRHPHKMESVQKTDQLSHRVKKEELDPSRDVAVHEEDREQRIEKSLEAIYVDDRGRVPDLSRLTRRPSFWVARATVVACLFLITGACLAWLGVSYGPSLFRQTTEVQAISIVIQAPPTITLGKEESFRVEYKNDSLTSLAQSDIRLAWPPEFTPTSFNPEPTDLEAKRWSLGMLPVQGSGVIEVKGVFTGSLGQQGILQAISTYRRGPLGLDEQVVIAQPIAYGDSVIMGALEAPEKVIAGDTFALRYRITNKGDIPLKGLLVRLILPEKFLLTQPKNTGNFIFSIGDLAPGASTTVPIVGSFPSGASGEMVFQGEVGRRAVDGTFLALQRNNTSFPLLAGDLGLRLIVNGGTGNRNMKPGEPLRVAVGYENISPETMKDVSLTLGFESMINGKSATGTSLVRWSGLNDPTKGVTSTRTRVQTITYTAEQILGLEAFLPQAKNSFEVSLPTLLVASGTKEAAIVVTISANVPTIGGTKVNRIVKTQPVTVRYQSDAEASVEARYYTEEGIPLGSGPLPPVVGKTTSYRIVWSVKKTFHALDQVVMSAVLPSRVEWNNRMTAEAGALTYDPATRTVQWKVTSMPDALKQAEATFEVQLTPGAADAGRFAALLSETKFDAQDALLKSFISQVVPAITTDLQQDESAKNKGVVRKE